MSDGRVGVLSLGEDGAWGGRHQAKRNIGPRRSVGDGGLALINSIRRPLQRRKRRLSGVRVTKGRVNRGRRRNWAGHGRWAVGFVYFRPVHCCAKSLQTTFGFAMCARA